MLLNGILWRVAEARSKERGRDMRKRWTLGALLAVTLTMTVPAAATAKPSSRVRNNDWVEIWCDTDTSNGDGNEITLSVGADDATVGGADDVLAKTVDASTFGPG